MATLTKRDAIKHLIQMGVSSDDAFISKDGEHFVLKKDTSEKELEKMMTTKSITDYLHQDHILLALSEIDKIDSLVTNIEKILSEH